MKVLLPILILLLSVMTVSSQVFEQDKLIADSIKIEISNFESKVYNLPLDSTMDNSAIYLSVVELRRSSEIRPNGGLRRRKDYSYLKPESDSVLIKNLIQANNEKIFKAHFINSKGSLYEKIKNHTLNSDLCQYIIGFDGNYLIIRSSSIMSTTNSRQTGPSYFIEKYVYYERIEIDTLTTWP